MVKTEVGERGLSTQELANKTKRCLIEFPLNADAVPPAAWFLLQTTAAAVSFLSLQLLIHMLGVMTHSA